VDLGVTIFVSLFVGQVLHLGEHLLEVPISAMLVLAVTGATQAAAKGRVLETLVGAVTGMTVNALLGPPVYVQRAGDTIGGLADDLAGLLKAMGEELTEGWSGEQVRAWVDRTGELDRSLRAAVQVRGLSRDLADLAESIEARDQDEPGPTGTCSPS
jgi:hypothetical protein